MKTFAPILNTPIRLTCESVAPNTLRYTHDAKVLPRFNKLWIVTESLPANVRERDLILTITVAPKQRSK
jgi:hypothetical protein